MLEKYRGMRKLGLLLPGLSAARRWPMTTGGQGDHSGGAL